MAADASALAVTETGAGVAFGVKVVPGSSRDRLQGLHGDRLKVAVTAPPERGKANAAVCRLLAAALAVPAGAVQVTRGAGNPNKQIAIAGLDAAALRERLARALRA